MIYERLRYLQCTVIHCNRQMEQIARLLCTRMSTIKDCMVLIVVMANKVEETLMTVDFV